MKKSIYIFFILFSFNVFADELNNKNISKIEMDVLRNDKVIGYSNYFFTHNEDSMIVENYTKFAVEEKREDYSGLQERIDKLKQKYQLIRDQKIRERVEALGVNVQEGDDRETLLEKEKNYTLERQKIENALESFYRSANSLVFQLNKRHITRSMSIFRCIDRRFENGEVYIKWDEVPDDEWLILIYIKDNSPSKGIVIEDKSNPEKNISNEFKPSEIFKASDMMVDSLTQLLERERSKKDN